MFFFKSKKQQITKDRDWKEKNEEYLIQLQSFLDKTDNVENETLRKDIIAQMLRCDLVLTELAEEQFDKYYNRGIEEAKMA